ncbi:septal ring lytic transglycosylase RlpA family protein [Thermosulfuriphilus ammonigenes]|uniref:Probable endolytic peptidoglycan transglycosylase RlpA n=1 Tax=Thermosulfuriphilus ammonigenes TaxID=1936021 RepID=A0A6G7PZ24_9BACT|nr:septal ring lytic transglycosylase RlpA family protein [Thermosulfuriphilus ammonigenes]
MLALILVGCAPRLSYIPSPPGPKPPATQRPYTVNGKTYYPLPSSKGFVEEGLASWYGPGFHGRRTANGERYDMYQFTAAHKVLPMNTYVLVTNLENGRQTIVRINDRGPFVKGRIIDLSYAAARALGMHRQGVARVRLVALGEGHEIKTARGPKIVFDKIPDLTRGRFYVQVGAFRSLKNARRFSRQLRRLYPRVEVVRYRRPDGQIFYRVQIFAATSYKAAKRFEAVLEAAGFSGAFVVAR